MIEHKARPGNFDSLAADYGRYRIGYSRELFEALEKFGFRRGASILDAGCGTGISSEPLVARGMQVTGIDPSAEMLATAKRDVPAATFLDGRVEELPFDDATFDGAVSAQAFHWFDAERAFHELIRVVRPGAPVAVWWKMLCSDDAMRSIRAAACDQAEVEPGEDPLRGGFRAFYRAPFASRSLRVLPFAARFAIEDWIGYERSRAYVRNTFGDRTDAYIDALRTLLVRKYGNSGARVEVRYSQYLYVGTTAAG
jgi:ubiquinone/menaquinone biosynthesis C-methylase UbiE